MEPEPLSPRSKLPTIPVVDNEDIGINHLVVIQKAKEILFSGNEATILNFFEFSDRFSHLSKTDLNSQLEVRIIKDDNLLKNCHSLINSMNNIKLCFEGLRLGIVKEYEFLCESVSLSSFEEPLKAYHTFYNFISSVEIKKSKTLFHQLFVEIKKRTEGIEDTMPDEMSLQLFSACYGTPKEEVRNTLKKFFITTNKIKALPILLEKSKEDMNNAINSFKRKFCFWAHHCATGINPLNWGYALSKQKFYRLHEWGFYNYIDKPIEFERGFLKKLDGRLGEKLHGSEGSEEDSETSDSCDCLHFRRGTADTEYDFHAEKEQI